VSEEEFSNLALIGYLLLGLIAVLVWAWDILGGDIQKYLGVSV
jgi:hypothetical protein